MTGACFHLKFYWIFSRGPNIQEKVIKRLTRGIKDISEGCFKAQLISGIIRNDELNPFESVTTIRDGYNTKRERSLLKLRSDRIEEMNANEARASRIDAEEYQMFV